MVDFSNTDISPVEGSKATAPTELPAGGAVVRAQAGGSNMQALGSVVKTGIDLFNNLKANDQSKALASFSDNQLALAAAVDQGTISSKEARTRMRANFTSFIADNPTQYDDVAKVHKDIISTAGLGKVVDTGTEKERAALQLSKDAAKAGFTDVNGNTDVGGYLEHENAKRNLEMISKKASTLSTQLSNRDKIAEQQSRSALADWARTGAPVIRNNINKLVESFNPEGPEAAAKGIELQQQVSASMAEVNALTASMGGGFNKEYAEQLAAPIKSLADFATKYAKGEITKQTYDTQVDNMMKIAELNFLNANKDIVPALAIMPHVKGLSVSLDSLFAPKVFDAVSNTLNNKAPNLSDLNGDEIKDTGEFVLQSLDDANKGAPAASKEQAASTAALSIQGMLKGVKDHAGNFSESQQFTELVKVLSDDRFGAYVENPDNYANINNVAVEASRVLNTFYADKVVASLTQSFTNATKGVSRPIGTTGILRANVQEPVSDIYEPFWTGAGVQFRIKEDFVMPSGPNEEFNRSGINLRLSNLNKTLAPTINRMNKMTAHLTGSRKYEKTWNEVWQPKLFPNEVEGAAPVTEAPVPGGDDLQTRMFAGATDGELAILEAQVQDENILKSVKAEIKKRKK